MEAEEHNKRLLSILITYIDPAVQKEIQHSKQQTLNDTNIVKQCRENRKLNIPVCLLCARRVRGLDEIPHQREWHVRFMNLQLLWNAAVHEAAAAAAADAQRPQG